MKNHQPVGGTKNVIPNEKKEVLLWWGLLLLKQRGSEGHRVYNSGHEILKFLEKRKQSEKLEEENTQKIRSYQRYLAHRGEDSALDQEVPDQMWGQKESKGYESIKESRPKESSVRKSLKSVPSGGGGVDRQRPDVLWRLLRNIMLIGPIALLGFLHINSDPVLKWHKSHLERIALHPVLQESFEQQSVLEQNVKSALLRSTDVVKVLREQLVPQTVRAVPSVLGGTAFLLEPTETGIKVYAPESWSEKELRQAVEFFSALKQLGQSNAMLVASMQSGKREEAISYGLFSRNGVLHGLLFLNLPLGKSVMYFKRLEGVELPEGVHVLDFQERSLFPKLEGAEGYYGYLKRVPEEGEKKRECTSFVQLWCPEKEKILIPMSVGGAVHLKEYVPMDSALWVANY